VPAPGVGADRGDGRDAVEPGHHDVDRDGVGQHLGRPEELETIDAVDCLVDIESGELHVGPDEESDRGGVVDD
jgi:hypothetical protein